MIDPLVEDLCREEAYFAGVATRVFDADTLRLRILLALMNEAGWMVENGVAPADLDLISVRVLGVPADCGGIATFADQLGAQNILRALRVLQQEDPAMWRPAPCFAAEG